MKRLVPPLLASLACAACGAPPPEIDYSGPTAEWREFAGTKGGSHFSGLTQIDRSNVEHLELAWQEIRLAIQRELNK